MAGLTEVIGLLYRADWTRLSLSAEVRSETDREPLPRLPRERWYRAWPGQGQDNGRYAVAGAAAPRRDVLGSGSAERPYDRIEVAVDAELGVLLRRIETSGGELVTLTELTDVTLNPPEAADPARFTPPPGSHRGETEGATFSGPGWAAADLAAGGLGALFRHAPHLLGHGAAGEQPEAMPSPDPAPLGPADGSPPPDE